jgi:hypothetical protein
MQAWAFVLRHQGRKRVDTAGEAMARITNERLVPPAPVRVRENADAAGAAHWR